MNNAGEAPKSMEVASPFAAAGVAPTYVSNTAPAVVVGVWLTRPSDDTDTRHAVLWHHLVHCTVDATLLQLGGCWKLWSGVPEVLLIAVSAAFGSNIGAVDCAERCARHALAVIAQLQQAVEALPCSVTAEFSLATGDVVAGIIGLRPPSFQYVAQSSSIAQRDRHPQGHGLCG